MRAPTEFASWGEGSSVRGKVSAAEAAKLSHEVARGAKDIHMLTRRLESLSKQFR